MRFSIRHRFDHPVDRVAAAVLESAYQDQLAGLPHVAERVVTEQTQRADGTVHRVVHYRFGGDLPAPVVRAVGGEVVTWDEVGDYDPATREWRFEIRPKVFRGGFEAHGTYRFVPEGRGAARDVVVEMRVKVPVVGRLVERTIRDGLVDTLDAEARILARYLDDDDA